MSKYEGTTIGNLIDFDKNGNGEISALCLKIGEKVVCINPEKVILTNKQSGGGQSEAQRKEPDQEIKEDENILSPLQKTLIVLFVGFRNNK